MELKGFQLDEVEDEDEDDEAVEVEAPEDEAGVAGVLVNDINSVTGRDDDADADDETDDDVDDDVEDEAGVGTTLKK